MFRGPQTLVPLLAFAGVAIAASLTATSRPVAAENCTNAASEPSLSAGIVSTLGIAVCAPMAMGESLTVTLHGPGGNVVGTASGETPLSKKVSTTCITGNYYATATSTYGVPFTGTTVMITCDGARTRHSGRVH
jgi:hypothetical protein